MKEFAKGIFKGIVDFVADKLQSWFGIDARGWLQSMGMSTDDVANALSDTTSETMEQDDTSIWSRLWRNLTGGKPENENADAPAQQNDTAATQNQPPESTQTNGQPAASQENQQSVSAPSETPDADTVAAAAASHREGARPAGELPQNFNANNRRASMPGPGPALTPLPDGP